MQTRGYLDVAAPDRRRPRKQSRGSIVRDPQNRLEIVAFTSVSTSPKPYEKETSARREA